MTKNQPDHYLKIYPEYFSEVLIGYKRSELRNKKDREFKVGQVIRLEEFSPKKGKSGSFVDVVITHILEDVNGLDLGYCIFSFERLIDSPHAQAQLLEETREALEDFRDFGVRHDLHPTNAHTWDFLRWQEWCQSMDRHIRDTAEQALAKFPPKA